VDRRVRLRGRDMKRRATGDHPAAVWRPRRQPALCRDRPRHGGRRAVRVAGLRPWRRREPDHGSAAGPVRLSRQLPQVRRQPAATAAGGAGL
jgi:hypothetical protein